jgi:hypothetical protein
MASCIITSGIIKPSCADKFGVPGVQSSKIYIANFDQVAFTETTPGLIDGISFDFSYSGMYVMELHDNTINFTEELVSGETAGSYYNQTFLGRTINTSNDTRSTVEDLIDVPVIVLYKTKKGQWWVVGESGGVKLTGDTTTDGAKTGDETGTLLTFTGVNNGKRKQFYNTSDANTDALVEGYVL